MAGASGMPVASVLVVASVEDVALDEALEQAGVVAMGEASAGAGFILPGGRGTDPHMLLLMDPYRQG